jgi:hypothetical protein
MDEQADAPTLNALSHREKPHAKSYYPLSVEQSPSTLDASGLLRTLGAHNSPTTASVHCSYSRLVGARTDTNPRRVGSYPSKGWSSHVKLLNNKSTFFVGVWPAFCLLTMKSRLCHIATSNNGPISRQRSLVEFSFSHGPGAEIAGDRAQISGGWRDLGQDPGNLD